jgi:hypothetical protein
LGRNSVSYNADDYSHHWYINGKETQKTANYNLLEE